MRVRVMGLLRRGTGKGRGAAAEAPGDSRRRAGGPGGGGAGGRAGGRELFWFGLWRRSLAPPPFHQPSRSGARGSWTGRGVAEARRTQTGGRGERGERKRRWGRAVLKSGDAARGPRHGSSAGGRRRDGRGAAAGGGCAWMLLAG